MENEPLFYEKQYFKQWWIWIVLVVINSIILYGATSQVVFGETFGDKPSSDLVLIILSIALLVLTAFMFTQKLITKIDDTGVYIKFRPYHKKWRLYTWEAIAECEIKKYRPIFDYGGWGIRPGVYSMSGSMGLLLKFKSGKPSLMIGTQKPEEVQIVLQQLGKL